MCTVVTVCVCLPLSLSLLFLVGWSWLAAPACAGAQVSVLLEMWGFGDPKKLEEIVAEKRGTH